MSNFENKVWEIHYRPKKVDDCILPTSTKELIKNYIQNGNVPSMLFTGTGGIGKTTLGRAIAAELGSDILFINASLEGNIDTLRTTIAQFVSTVSFAGGKKIVLLDEADHLTAAVQPGLRGFMDEFQNNAIFILTCNFKERIIAPLISRLTVIDFKFNKDERADAAKNMLKRACFILDTESIEYDKKCVAAVVTKNFPDFRKTIGTLQRYSAGGKIDEGILANNSDVTISELVTYVKEKNFSKCRQWVANNTLDSNTFYRTIYDKVLPELVPQTIPPVILAIAESQFHAAHSVDQEINQIAFLIQFMQTAQFK